MFSSDLQTASLARSQERCLDLVRRWLSLYNADSCSFTIERFSDLTDEQLTDQCIARWGLDQVQGDDNNITWFEEHDADRFMLMRAFGIVREWHRASKQSDF
jgi:hypothetical protein